jgi:protein-disulfide isomerase
LKPKKKINAYAERQRQERERQEKERKRRIIFFSTMAVVLIAIIIAIILRPSPAQPEAAPAQFDYSNMPVLGNPNAPVKIVEYGDYQCPSCRNFSQSIKPELVKNFVDTGKAAIYFQDLIVLDGDGLQDSHRAALAAHSIYHQDKDSFWKFNDAMYREQGEEKSGWVTTDFLVNLAKSEKLPVDYDKLKADIENKTYGQEVEDSIATAEQLKVDSTPTFFINGQAYTGKYDYDSFKKAIESASKGE